MIINYASANEYPKSIISIDDIPLNNVHKFEYLGCYIDYLEPNSDDSEINLRIQMASVKFNEMSNLMQNFQINLKTRVKFLNSFVRSRLTYACQNWNITQSQFDCIDATYRMFLKRMVRNGLKRSYVAHVIRMSVHRNVKKLTFNNDTYRRRGRPVKSLVDQVVENKNVTIDRFCNLALQRKR